MRVPEWEHRLSEYLAEAQQHPFRWGKRDCGSLALGLVERMTGRKSRLAALQYTSRRAAYAAIAAACGGGLLAMARAVAEEMNFPEIPAGLAQRGDVVAAFSVKGVGLGAVGMDGSAWIYDERGRLVPIPLSRCLTAWRVS